MVDRPSWDLDRHVALIGRDRRLRRGSGVVVRRWGLRVMTSSDAVVLRILIDLPEADRDRLDAYCRQQGVSRAQALRAALTMWLEHPQPDHQAMFGLWRDRPGDALAQQRALRQKWAGR